MLLTCVTGVILVILPMIVLPLWKKYKEFKEYKAMHSRLDVLWYRHNMIVALYKLDLLSPAEYMNTNEF